MKSDILSMLSLMSVILLERHGSLAEYREIREFLEVVVVRISSSQIHVISGPIFGFQNFRSGGHYRILIIVLHVNIRITTQTLESSRVISDSS